MQEVFVWQQITVFFAVKAGILKVCAKNEEPRQHSTLEFFVVIRLGEDLGLSF